MHDCADGIHLQPLRDPVRRMVAEWFTWIAAFLLAGVVTVIWVVMSAPADKRLGYFLIILLLVVFAALTAWISRVRSPQQPAARKLSVSARPGGVRESRSEAASLCPHGVLLNHADQAGRLIGWDAVRRLEVLFPPTGQRPGVVVASFVSYLEPTGLPVVSRLFTGEWVPDDPDLRWLGCVERRDASAVSETVNRWRHNATEHDSSGPATQG